MHSFRVWGQNQGWEEKGVGHWSGALTRSLTPATQTFRVVLTPVFILQYRSCGTGNEASEKGSGAVH